MANQLVFNKESKINNGEKIVSSGSGVRGTEQPHVNQNTLISYTKINGLKV